MVIFYCILLVVLIFLVFMEACIQSNKMPTLLSSGVNDKEHIVRVLIYLIMFIFVSILLKYELYM